MFGQKKRWSSGTIRRDGRTTEVTVPPPGEVADGVVLSLIFVWMFCGIIYIAFSADIRITSVTDLLRFSPEFVFGLILLWIFRGLWERSFAEQIVTVIPGNVTLTTATRWWTRQRNLGAVQEVSALPVWGGFGRVVLKANGREYSVFRERITSQEAVRLANELKHAIKG